VTFFATADTPKGVRKADVDRIGSAADVLVYRDHVKDAAGGR
jgi:hypothetical protein